MLAEYGDIVLAANYTQQGFIFCTWEQDLKVLLEKITWGYPEIEENPPSFSDGEQQTDTPNQSILQ